MNIRKSMEPDILKIMSLIHQAQKYFKQSHIDQWQDGYPNSETILDDIHKKYSYVLIDEDIVGTMYFAIEADPCYSVIQGNWLTCQQPYAVIHRIVVDETRKGQNLAYQLLSYVIHECEQKEIRSIRIDTHEDNLSMQRFLTKHGFVACGTITLASGAPRIGFEKILNK
ncbi:GNAT family N-acetyltransferase [Candidatus Stoquefichus massiliensis]|uniref:GNAT family N-acetyltransferase n=1 Tax=Candidatus Stoquefichus massiliensis TaxID=1470350 RepID=UPI000485875F|nr:GNAT family N-acetyltransferase [Candidatus Stoquefichus massiliensis]